MAAVCLDVNQPRASQLIWVKNSRLAPYDYRGGVNRGVSRALVLARGRCGDQPNIAIDPRWIPGVMPISDSTVLAMGPVPTRVFAKRCPPLRRPRRFVATKGRSQHVGGWGRWLVLVLLALVVGRATASEVVAFKGYYKNLFVHSRTAFPLDEAYTLDLNRLRLEARGRSADGVGFEVQYDHEALLGSYVDTAQFAQLKAMPPPTYWDVEDDYLDRGSAYARHRLYRGFVTLEAPLADVLIGRQRIAWGSGRFWNPTDLFNPYNPAQLERDERIGVDAVLVEKSLDALSRLSLAYAPQRDAAHSRALRYRTNMANTDLAVMAGEFRGDRVVGVEFAGRLGEASLYGEVAYTHPATGPAFTRAVLGSEYAFVNTLTVGVELYWNGAGAADEARYDFTRLFAGAIQNVARRYVGGHLKYEITPLLRSDNYVIVNLDDGSRFVAPGLVYSLATNWDVSVGVQSFGGAGASEYGRFHDLYYVYLQWFF